MKMRDKCNFMLALLVTGALSAHAVVLSYEPFDGYVLGGELGSTASNITVAGYSGDWVDFDFGDQEPLIQSGSLEYMAAGQAVGVPATTGTEITAGNSGRVYRLLDSSLAVTDATTGTLYLGFLFKSGQETGATTYQTLALYDIAIADANRNFDIGLSNNGGQTGTEYDFGVDGSYSSTGVAADSAVHLLVVKFVLSADASSDSVTVWIDPTSEVGGIDVSGVDLTWDRLALSDYDGNSAAWDEIRWGNTFNDVLTAIDSIPSVISKTPSMGGIVTNAFPLIEVLLADGSTPVNTNSIVLSLDGYPLAHSLSKLDTTTTVSHAVSSALAVGLHTASIVFDGTPSTGPFTNSWDFSVSDPNAGLYVWTIDAPTPGADDIYQFTAPDADWDNIGGFIGGSNITSSGQNDPSTFVAGDKNSSQGQLFTTAPGNFELTSVWVKHVAYTTHLDNGTWASLVPGNSVTIRIVDPAQTNSANFVVYSEVLKVVTNSINSAGTDGTGLWMEYRLSAPVKLSSETQYGFDLTSHDNGTYFELAGMGTNDLYNGGDAYTTGSKEALNTGTVHAAGDRTFLVALTPAGPEVTPNIQSIIASGGSATLTWDSEFGITYSIFSKGRLTDATWVAATNGIAGVGATTSASVPSSSTHEFFKVEGH